MKRTHPVPFPYSNFAINRYLSPRMLNTTRPRFRINLDIARLFPLLQFEAAPPSAEAPPHIRKMFSENGRIATPGYPSNSVNRTITEPVDLAPILQFGDVAVFIHFKHRPRRKPRRTPSPPGRHGRAVSGRGASTTKSGRDRLPRVPMPYAPRDHRIHRSRGTSPASQATSGATRGPNTHWDDDARRVGGHVRLAAAPFAFM